MYGILESLDTETIRLIYSEDNEQLEQFMNVVRWYIKQNFDD